ncbi:MAG: hypothetical protein V4441_04260 [Pseudomonadota bacterium]
MSDSRKLPVFTSVGEVLSGVTRHYFQLLMVAWPALLIITFGVFVIGWQYYNVGLFSAYTADNGGPDVEAIMAAEAKLQTSTNMVFGSVMQLALAVASAVAAVRWHRFVLLGEGTGGVGGVQPLRREDGSYVWATIKIFVVLVLLILAFASVLVGIASLRLPDAAMSILGLVSVIAFFWLYLAFFRMMLALPDAALGQGGRLGDMYKASTGNGWRLLGFGFLLCLAVITIVALVAALFAAIFTTLGVKVSTSPIALSLIAVAYIAVYLFFLMTQITMLSVAYREIIGLPPVPSRPI